MIKSFLSHSKSVKNAKGFTLVEVMLSLLIVSFILLITMQVTGGVTKIIADLNGRLDTQATTGISFSIIQDDVSSRLDRVDSPLNHFSDPETGNDQLSFYIKKPAFQEVSVKTRDLSLVHYLCRNGELLRGSVGLVFSEEEQKDPLKGHLVLGTEYNIFKGNNRDDFPSALPGSYFDVLASGVLRFEVGFMGETSDGYAYIPGSKVVKDKNAVDLSLVDTAVITVVTVDAKRFYQIKELARNREGLWAELAERFEEMPEHEFDDAQLGPIYGWERAAEDAIAEGGRLADFFRAMSVQQLFINLK